MIIYRKPTPNIMEQLQAKTTELIDPKKLKRAVYERHDQAVLKANKEVVNKTKGDEEHTFIMTVHLDESTLVLWAQNMNNPQNIIVDSRYYLIALPYAAE